MSVDERDFNYKQERGSGGAQVDSREIGGVEVGQRFGKPGSEWTTPSHASAFSSIPSA
jgi:hypothetical protein